MGTPSILHKKLSLTAFTYTPSIPRDMDLNIDVLRPGMAIMDTMVTMEVRKL